MKGKKDEEYYSFLSLTSTEKEWMNENEDHD